MKIPVFHILALLLLPILFGNLAAQPYFPAKKNGQWGYIDTNGTPIIDFQFDKASAFENKTAKALKGQSLFVIQYDRSMTEIKDCKRFMPINGQLYKAQKGNLWWLTDADGNMLSQRGYYRIWRQPFNEKVLMVMQNGKAGLLKVNGEETIPCIHDNLSPLSSQLYSARQTNNTYTLVNEQNERITQDTFKSVKPVDRALGIYLCEKNNREMMMITETGTTIVRDHRLMAVPLGNGFVSVEKNGAFFLYDAFRGVFIDSLRGAFASGNLPNTALWNDGKTSRLFNRYSGLEKPNWNPIIISSAAFNRPAIAMNPLYGLLDSNNNEVLPFLFLDIKLLDNRRMMIRDSTLLIRIYDFTTNSWVNEEYYNTILSGEGFIKAYGGNRCMDYYALNPDGSIDEIIKYKNVYHQNVIQRQLAQWDNNLQSTSGISQTQWRETGWFSTLKTIPTLNYSTLIMGIRQFDSSLGKFRILLQPTFTTVKVLKVPSLSMAGYNNSIRNKSSVYEVKNSKATHIPPINYCLVNDATGKRLTPMLGYIDENDCENPAAREFRAFQGGYTTLYSKNTLKSVYKCLYASRLENGVRKIYTGGQFVLENELQPQNTFINDFTFLNGSGLSWRNARTSIQMSGGQWILSFSDGRMIKPAIAGDMKIVRMLSLENGRIIVTLSNGKLGVIDTLGNTIIEPKYDYITTHSNFPGHLFCGVKSNKRGLANQYGDLISPPNYDNIIPLGSAYKGTRGDSTFIFSPNQEEIFIPSTGKPIPFEDGVGFIKHRNGYALAKENGAQILDIHFRKALPFHESYAPAQNNLGWGLIDANGNWLWKPKYTASKNFGYTCGVFQHYSKWVFVTTEGKRLKGPKRAQAIEEISEGIFVYKNKNKFGIFNGEGKRLASFRFPEKPIIMNEMVVASKGSRIYFYSLSGDKLGHLPGIKNGKNSQLLNQQIKSISRRGDDYTKFYFTPGQLRAFGQDSPWVQLELPLAISRFTVLQREQLYEAYVNDVYLTNSNNSYNFVNSNNEPLVTGNFNQASPMKNGMSICSKEEKKFGILSRDGFWLLTPEYSDIKQLNDSTFSYRIAYDYDIYNASGNLIMDETVDSYQAIGNVLYLHKDSRIGYYISGKGLIHPLQD